jgi:hypothetical protein
MIERVVWLLNSELKVPASKVKLALSPSQKALIEKQFGLYLFNTLLPATDPLVLPHVQRAKQLFEHGSPTQWRLWKSKHKGKLSRLSWRVLPYHAARAALSVDKSALARFTEYTAKALAVHRSCRTSLRHARKALRNDDYHIWADFSTALAALVRA